VRLEPGSALVLFTDGLIEDPGWENPYAAEWFREVLARCASREADEIVESLKREVLHYATEGRDDRALLVVAVPGSNGSGQRRPTAT
jgi:serine phosphatase RsbU (regulator of sigma subunit)